jgi:hypothetical protein
LLDKVELAVEFREENYQNPQRFAGKLKDRGNIGEIGLIVEDATTAAVCCLRCTFESFYQSLLIQITFFDPCFLDWSSIG